MLPCSAPFTHPNDKRDRRSGVLDHLCGQQRNEHVLPLEGVKHARSGVHTLRKRSDVFCDEHCSSLAQDAREEQEEITRAQSHLLFCFFVLGGGAVRVGVRGLPEKCKSHREKMKGKKKESVVFVRGDETLYLP